MWSIYREGNWVRREKFDPQIWPVENLSKFLELCSIENNSDEYIFRTITDYPKKNTQKLRKGNKPISYTRTGELILEINIGENPKSYGAHNLRADGVTTAANAGTSDRLFNRHGVCKSGRAIDAYIKDNLNSLLSVLNRYVWHKNPTLLLFNTYVN